MALFEESLLWSAEQRAASLAATLACRPDDGSVWIFGYGSLIWNPALNLSRVLHRHAAGLEPRVLPAVDRRARYVPASRDACWLSKRAAEPPASPIVCLDDTLEEELTLLWKREMITGCYLPTWCKLELDDGRTVNALVLLLWIRAIHWFEPDTSAQVIAPLIARASGAARHQRPVSVFA
ncbi:Uncharacterized protein involved in cation transport [Serratia liquefaciens]|nr:Uncharacterized protein involved in cation transport [Serratia liquefaciens]